MHSVKNSKKTIDFKLQNDKEEKKNLYIYNEIKTNNKKYNNYNEDPEHKLIEQLPYNRNEKLTINKEITESFLYRNNYIRKPVEIKFENGFKFSNLSNNLNICNNSPISSKNKNNCFNKNEERKDNCVKLKTNVKLKSDIFFGKNIDTSDGELYRNYKELEKKSLEISKRKIRKNLSSKVIDFKKDTNLGEIRHSLKNIKNSKSKKNRGNNKLKVIKVSNIKDISNNIKLLNNQYILVNSIKDNSINENNFKTLNIKKALNKTNNYQETNSNNDFNSKNKEKKINKNSNNFIGHNSHKIIHLKNYPKNEMNINEKNSQKKNYDININKRTPKKIIEINLNKDINYHEIKNQNNKPKNIYKNKSPINKIICRYSTPLVKKKFKEDFHINSNEKNTSHSNNNSYLNLSASKNKINFQTNAREINNISKKQKINILPSIEEESSSKFHNKFILKTMESNEKTKEEFSKVKIIKKSVFNVEKQKIILLKRKKFDAFQKYENCKDFIDNIRLKIIKYIFGKRS